MKKAAANATPADIVSADKLALSLSKLRNEFGLQVLINLESIICYDLISFPESLYLIAI